MDGDDRILAIVLTAEHFLDLGGLDFLIERVEALRELGVDSFAGFRPFDQNGQVVALPAQRVNQLAVLFEGFAALQDFLRLRLVLPEIGGSGARFEACQFVLRAGRFKDSSADRSRVE